MRVGLAGAGRRRGNYAGDVVRSGRFAGRLAALRPLPGGSCHLCRKTRRTSPSQPAGALARTAIFSPKRSASDYHEGVAFRVDFARRRLPAGQRKSSGFGRRSGSCVVPGVGCWE